MRELNFLVKLAPYAKAVAAFVALLIPVLTALGILLQDIGQGQVQAQDFVALFAAIAALVGGTRAVYQTKNQPKV